jgi:hypothetical protein
MMLCVIMLYVVMLNVVMLSVMAPEHMRHNSKVNGLSAATGKDWDEIEEKCLNFVSQ